MSEDGPTTFNGLLHTPEARMDDRVVSATFATPADANTARDRLIEGGIAADRITIVDNAGDSRSIREALKPEDQGILGKVREAIVPDDSKTATRKAAANNASIMEVRPAKSEVETVVRIIEASHPSLFDASLERWRNVG